MPRYLVTINEKVEVEADSESDAENVAAQFFEWRFANFEVEEIDDD